MERLWISNRGEVACDAHLGGYGTQELAARPNAKRLDTPLDVWHVATDADRADWRAEIGTDLACETCRFRGGAA